MDILTPEIREILSRIRDLEFLANSVYGVRDEEYVNIVTNIVELKGVLKGLISNRIEQQLKYESEMKKLGDNMELFDASSN